MQRNHRKPGATIAALALAAGLLAVPPASAALIWNWSYSSDGIAASGTFTTGDVADAAGYYDISAITGTRNGVAITGLTPAGTEIPNNAGFPVDDLIASSSMGAQITGNGFGYSLADGTSVNPFYADWSIPASYHEVLTSASAFLAETPIVFSASPLPEPASAGLVAAGLLALGWAGGRRLRPVPRR
ncbi:MAG: hypothetical protein KGM91_27500 [Burkholderiales bacterium]|nr:hypothetical protein [Burkholderiales bacterium]